MILSRKLAIHLLISTLPCLSSAFWEIGHLLVSRRAQAILESHPFTKSALALALKDLSYLQESHPKLTSKESSNSERAFTECAIFADHIKGMGFHWQKNWHFFSQPHYVEDYKGDQGYDENDGGNLLDALTDLFDFMKGKDVTGSVYVDKIVSELPNLHDQRSFVLRLLTHYIGDMHQPLHLSSLFSKDFPKGDRGGNFQKLPKGSKSQPKNLHALWDSILAKYTHRPSLPLNDKDWDWYTERAEDLASQHKVSMASTDLADFKEWAAEGPAIAKAFIYPGFTPGEQPSEEYKQQGMQVINERLMVAGSRLASLVASIYGDENSNEFLAFKDFLQ